MENLFQIQNELTEKLNYLRENDDFIFELPSNMNDDDTITKIENSHQKFCEIYSNSENVIALLHQMIGMIEKRNNKILEDHLRMIKQGIAIEKSICQKKVSSETDETKKQFEEIVDKLHQINNTVETKANQITEKEHSIALDVDRIYWKLIQ